MGYKKGDSDYSRGWGGYVVTAIGVNAQGEEVCEKDITIRPGQVMSLQSHDRRRELWQVVSGTLTAILDGQRKTLHAGESIRIPRCAIHCMANLGMANLGAGDVVVHEVQEGLCAEDDIHRYASMYGQQVEDSDSDAVRSSRAIYDDILAEIGFNADHSNEY